MPRLSQERINLGTDIIYDALLPQADRTTDRIPAEHLQAMKEALSLIDMSQEEIEAAMMAGQQAIKAELYREREQARAAEWSR